jgi:DNA-binding NtrC family response regulator
MYELYHEAFNDESGKKKDLLFTVTLIDDDPFILETLKDHLLSMKISQVECFSSGEEFLSAWKENDRRLVVCDFDFGSPDKMNGLQVLEEIKKRDPGLPVIILSAQDNMSVALQSLRKGATDYFIKGTENTFTSVLTSVLKINELFRLKKNEKDYITTLVVGSVAAIIIIGILMYALYK